MFARDPPLGSSGARGNELGTSEASHPFDANGKIWRRCESAKQSPGKRDQIQPFAQSSVPFRAIRYFSIFQTKPPYVQAPKRCPSPAAASRSDRACESPRSPVCTASPPPHRPIAPPTPPPPVATPPSPHERTAVSFPRRGYSAQTPAWAWCLPLFTHSPCGMYRPGRIFRLVPPAFSIDSIGSIASATCAGTAR